MVYEGTTVLTVVSMCSSFQFQMNKKETVIREFDLFVANWLTNVVFCDHLQV